MISSLSTCSAHGWWERHSHKRNGNILIRPPLCRILCGGAFQKNPHLKQILQCLLGHLMGKADLWLHPPTIGCLNLDLCAASSRSEGITSPSFKIPVAVCSLNHARIFSYKASLFATAPSDHQPFHTASRSSSRDYCGIPHIPYGTLSSHLYKNTKKTAYRQVLCLAKVFFFTNLRHG